MIFCILGKIRHIETDCDNVTTACGTDGSEPVKVATSTLLQYLNDNSILNESFFKTKL